MADTDTGDRKSRMEKAEGDRPDEPSNQERGGAGITNRPLDEEIENQERVPERGDTKPGAHAG